MSYPGRLVSVFSAHTSHIVRGECNRVNPRGGVSCYALRQCDGVDLADTLTVAGVIVATIGAAFMFGVPVAAILLGLALTGAGLYLASSGVRR